MALRSAATGQPKRISRKIHTLERIIVTLATAQANVSSVLTFPILVLLPSLVDYFLSRTNTANHS
ncbi:UNVERIFIED_CONTAM: hypothetical protein NCL1_36311 [Trichonephila clavipes]